MPIQPNDTLPDQPIMIVGPDGPTKSSVRKELGAGLVVLFAVPGAFTPTCSAKHLPGFVQKKDALKAKGVDRIACLAVNDAFVMEAWAKDAGASGDILMLADFDASFAKALGLSFDGSAFGLGERAQRFALVARDGVVGHVFVEEPGAFEVSSAEHVLSQL